MIPIYVYILESEKGGYYVGIGKDPDLRLKKHNNGGVHSTKNRRPFKLIHREKFEDYKKARIREKEIKSFKGGNKLKELIKYCRVV